MKLFKKLSTLAVSAFLLLGVGLSIGQQNIETKATECSFDLSKAPDTSSTTQLTWTSSPISITQNKNTSSTNANNYIPTSNTSTRIYKGMNMVFDSGNDYVISSIVFTATSTGYATAIKNATWATGASSVSNSTTTITVSPAAKTITGTFTATAGISSIVVTYSLPSTKSLVSIALSGDMTNKTYSVGDEWNFNGLTVTGTYDDESTEDLTTGSTLSGNPTTALDSTVTSVIVTAAYTGVESVTKTVTGIVVNELPEFSLVTDLTSINIGDRIVIANSDGTIAMGSQNTNNRNQVTASISNNVITPSSGYSEFILGIEKNGDNLAYTLRESDVGFLYAASSSSNYLRSKTDLDPNGKWTITLTNGTFSLTANGTYSKNIMRYNSSSSCFSCYSSGQAAVSLYYKSVSPSASVLAEYVNEANVASQCSNRFSLAKEMYLALSSDEQTLFKTAQDGESSSMTNARERYLAWATNQGQKPWETGAALGNLETNSDSNIQIVSIAVIGVISLASVGAFFFHSKKRIINK